MTNGIVDTTEENLRRAMQNPIKLYTSPYSPELNKKAIQLLKESSVPFQNEGDDSDLYEPALRYAFAGPVYYGLSEIERFIKRNKKLST